MHYETSLLYEGPPCDMCRRIMFIGTCTHRPMKMPDFPPIKVPPDPEIVALLASLAKQGESSATKPE